MSKAIAMAHGINLHSPGAHSMAQHRRRRRSTAIALVIALALVCALAVRWMVRG
jgi:predicted nucleic acid-binding Zn ribbon protein